MTPPDSWSQTPSPDSGETSRLNLAPDWLIDALSAFLSKPHSIGSPPCLLELLMGGQLFSETSVWGLNQTPGRYVTDILPPPTPKPIRSYNELCCYCYDAIVSFGKTISHSFILEVSTPNVVSFHTLKMALRWTFFAPV